MKRTNTLLAPMLSDPEVFKVTPALEASDIHEAMEQAAELTSAAAASRAIRAAEHDAGMIQFNLESFYSTLATLNENGGITAPQFQITQIGLDNISRRLDLDPIDLGVTLESFDEANPKHQVKLEGMEQVISLLDGNHADLALDEMDANDDSCEVLKSALPNCAQRLVSIVNRAEAGGVNNDNDSIPADGIVEFLMDGDVFCDDFADYINKYISLGRKILGPFSVSAKEAVAKAAAFRDVSFDDVDSFSQTSMGAFTGLVDPRHCLDDVDYETCLPGNGPLFATDDEAYGDSDGAYDTMCRFANVSAPCDPNDFTQEGDVQDTLPTLSAEEISAIGRGLHALILEADPAQFQEDVAASAECIDATIATYVQAYDEAPESTMAETSHEAGAISDCLHAVRTMAVVTPIYFMTNLVQTVNAFLVYAERSLSGSESPSTDE
jgi:hypothetical protein